jgi:aquaporin Z
MKSLFPLFISELIGTALLVAVGLSIVIFNWGDGSITAHYIPSVDARRLISGFLFGTTGCLITLSPVGKISGAHINPAMSFAFWLHGKMKTPAFIGYVAAQMVGSAIGAIPLLLWGNQGKSVLYGATLVGPAGVTAAFFGEVVTTIGLVATVFIFVGNKKLRRYTPYTMAPLFCIMVWAEAVYSGCSTNPARSFGPAFIANFYGHYWVFVAAPLAGAFITVGFTRIFRQFQFMHIKAARLSFHSSPTHESIKESH